MINPQEYIQEDQWYKTDIPRQEFRAFMTKNNVSGILNTILWLGSLIGVGYLSYQLIGTLWAIPSFLLYGMLYCACDARWHESSHGTVFKTPWLNVALCFIATAMQQRDIIFTNWSHVRHHSYTIINDIDPEITVTRPPTFWEHFLNFFSLGEMKYYVPILIQHAFGIVSEDAKKFVPKEEYNSMFWWARASLLVNLIPFALAIYFNSWIPLLYFGTPKIYGNIIQRLFILQQHAGLDEDVWDHRKNSRTVIVNPFFGFLFMNMQYHVEHHMHPLMPFHQLPKFHKRVKDQLPKPYNGLWAVYKEMIPALFKQVKDPNYFIDRPLPDNAAPAKVKRIKDLEPDKAMVPMAAKKSGVKTEAGTDKNASQEKEEVVATTDEKETTTATTETLEWHIVTAASELSVNDAINVKVKGKDYAIFQLEEGEYYATNGICTHEHAVLAEGVIENCTISCPKHNSKFNIKTGKALNRPAKKPLTHYPIKVEGDNLLIGLAMNTEAVMA